MGLGNTAKKLQRVAEMAEKLYTKLDELRTQVNEVREDVERTSHTVEGIERELDEQRAIVDALAREQDIDVDALLAETTIEEGEPSARSDDAEPPDEAADERPPTTGQ